jgi:hypothetical protein
LHSILAIVFLLSEDVKFVRVRNNEASLFFGHH